MRRQASRGLHGTRYGYFFGYNLATDLGEHFDQCSQIFEMCGLAVLGITDETTGPKFTVDLLQAARNQTLDVVSTLSRQITPGMTEQEAKTLLLETQKKKGIERAWHAPQVRFGKNTLRPFGERGVVDSKLLENDIFFIDLGLVYREHEGDVGRTFVTGNDSEMLRCCNDVEEIWKVVRSHWNGGDATGEELYRFARERTKERGWLLSLNKANGHRISDFPHSARARGSIEGWSEVPQSNRWILEIQIRHPQRDFGAFYEDLLV